MTLILKPTWTLVPAGRNSCYPHDSVIDLRFSMV